MHVTLEEIKALDPRIEKLFQEAKLLTTEPPNVFCGLHALVNGENSMKKKVSKLVGWNRPKDERGGKLRVLGSSMAYDLVYQGIYAAIPPCEKYCHCSGERPPSDEIDDPRDGKWSPDLLCNIISHKLTGNSVSLFLTLTDSPDMMGSIKCAKRIHAAVERIQIFNDNKESDGYSLGMSGQWECDCR